MPPEYDLSIHALTAGLGLDQLSNWFQAVSESEWGPKPGVMLLFLVSALHDFLCDMAQGAQQHIHKNDKMLGIFPFLQIVCIYNTTPVVSDYCLGQFCLA